MPLDVSLNDKAIEHLNDRAKAELKASVEKFAVDVLQEAGRYEKNLRSSDGDPEMISSMVRDANIVIRRGYIKPPKSRWMLALVASTNILAFVAGALLDYRNEIWGFIGIVACLVVLVILEMIQYQRD